MIAKKYAAAATTTVIGTSIIALATLVYIRQLQPNAPLQIAENENASIPLTIPLIDEREEILPEQNVTNTASNEVSAYMDNGETTISTSNNSTPPLEMKVNGQSHIVAPQQTVTQEQTGDNLQVEINQSSDSAATNKTRQRTRIRASSSTDLYINEVTNNE